MPDFMQKNGLGKTGELPGSSSMRPRFANRLYLPVDKGTQIILLDDEAVQVYEHSVYIQGDKGAMRMKVTCISPGADPVPDKCRICNAMIKDERVARKFIAYLSCIDLAVFEIDGRKITHTRKLVPLNHQAAKRLLRRREGIGSLKGAMFKIFRNQRTSPQVGDDWDYVKTVDLNGFKKSPRIKMLQEFFAKQGKQITPKEAFQLLISPFDYKEELEPTKQKVDYFLGYIGFGDAPVEKDSSEETGAGFNYADDSLGSDKDFDEEDFNVFDDASPPKNPKKNWKKVLKKKRKKKRN